MRPRLIAALCAPLALCTLYCDQNVGGGLTVNISLAKDSASCVNNAGCNSFNCVDGTCAPPAPGLIEVDGDCTGGGSCVPNTSCQGGICVQTSTWCVPDGTPCSGSFDCCMMDCNFTGGDTQYCGSPTTGTGASTTGTGCAAAGMSCFESSDCCNGSCDPGELICCFAPDSSCSVSSDCCSGFCDDSLGTCD